MFFVRLLLTALIWPCDCGVFEVIFFPLTEALQSWMHIWSLSLSLALICSTGGVLSQSCTHDFQCDGGKCCTRTCSNERSCPCQDDRDCKFGEECSYPGGFCYKSELPTLNIPTYKFKVPYHLPSTYGDSNCVWDSDCGYSRTCEDGQCVGRLSGGGSSSSGSRIVGIVLFVTISTIVSCLYHLCKGARKPPVPAGIRNGNLTAPSTGVDQAGEHEMQPGTGAAPSATVVQIEDDTPGTGAAPPPYNSLEFESRQNGDENLAEQPPPSYDEAVRNSAASIPLA